jgi:hypothetical protein
MKPLAQSQRERVLAALTLMPMTDQEGAAATGLSGDSYRPRRVWLLDKGFIEPCGERPTKSGKQAVIYQVKGKP